HTAAVDKMAGGLVNEWMNECDNIAEFPIPCPSCQVDLLQRMAVLDIPHFKELIIMAIKCEACGYKSIEVKPGGGISPIGRNITFRCNEQEDLERFLLKSDSATVEIPELELKLEEGTLGGLLTTVEGLLLKIKDELYSMNAFLVDDANDMDTRRKVMAELMANLDAMMQGKKPFTIRMDDPLALSYVQNIYAPDPDPSMDIVDYERTYEQNEELGINDMVTEGYEAKEEEKKE
ncbi:hypothetical protein KIPB_010437, partial [Kipferlia bialata]